jgi:hypothetical protein
MTLDWIDRKDIDNPGHLCSKAYFASGWLTVEVYHSRSEEPDDTPWNATIKGGMRSCVLIGYGSMEEAKRVAEERVREVVEFMKKNLEEGGEEGKASKND